MFISCKLFYFFLDPYLIEIGPLVRKRNIPVDLERKYVQSDLVNPDSLGRLKARVRIKIQIKKYIEIFPKYLLLIFSLSEIWLKEFGLFIFINSFVYIFRPFSIISSTYSFFLYALESALHISINANTCIGSVLWLLP